MSHESFVRVIYIFCRQIVNYDSYLKKKKKVKLKIMFLFIIKKKKKEVGIFSFTKSRQVYFFDMFTLHEIKKIIKKKVSKFFV